ncbi:hypothetical protein LSH36_314g03058 [Paralvinella palmiformis]|uniref:Endonuclease/exonuclease/phosphatase domain-containing protein n=1 Tax=Paralvinella palmiformis TaxID=53620 RepID=A0AAD9JIS3_9ANNE|nr:hypothetical protein LSH36_314g03058 [Paralvinella palmiformis]
MILDYSKQRVEDIVIVGDVNMPDIDWESWIGRSESDVLFIETLQDQFMHQHVDEPTRFRSGQKPSLLDLVISSKEELVSDITYREPLGKSDHPSLSFSINTEPETINTSQQRYRMDKGDYTRLEDIIQSISWEENTKDMNIEET